MMNNKRLYLAIYKALKPRIMEALKFLGWVLLVFFGFIPTYVATYKLFDKELDEFYVKEDFAASFVAAVLAVLFSLFVSLVEGNFYIFGYYFTVSVFGLLLVSITLFRAIFWKRFIEDVEKNL